MRWCTTTHATSAATTPLTGGQSASTMANTPPGRRIRATSACVDVGSIQCIACTAITTSALSSASPVAWLTPARCSTPGPPWAMATARMSSFGSMPMTRPAHPAAQRDDRPVPLPRSTTTGRSRPA